MGYTNIRETVKSWDPHTKKIKYCSFAKFDEHSNKFLKGWTPSYKIMTVKNASSLPTLKNDLSDDPLDKI